MALPVEYGTCRITGRWVNLQGDSIKGSILFTARTKRLTAAASSTVIIPTVHQVSLDPNGEIDVLLPATDDPDVSPVGFTYSVQEKFAGGSTYDIEAPVDGEVDLSTVVEVQAGTGATILQGPAGEPAPVPVTHDWDADGWTPFTRLLVNPHGAATVAETVENSRGRLTGHTDTTDGNRRDWWLRDGTLWADSEITSLWWGPSIMDSAAPLPATPQMGHVHRAVEAPDGTWTAYVVTNNIFGSVGETINLNVWGTDETTLTLGSNGGSSTFSGSLDRALTVTAVRRQELFIWMADLFVSNTHMLAGVVPGDVMTSDVSDNTFDFTDIAVDAVGAGPGYLRFRDPVSTTAVAPTTASGTITPKNRRRYFPYWVKSQLLGTVLRVKVWPIAQAEPDWGDTQRVVSFDTAGANDPAPNIAAAPTGPGYCGLVSAHLRSSAHLEYGETTFRQL